MRGNITRRGKASWRLKFDIDAGAGKRETRYATVRGPRQAAEKELTRLLSEFDKGMVVDSSAITVAVYIKEWLDRDHALSPKTLERYREVTERQITPHLGTVVLQKLKPHQIMDWHSALIKAGLAPGTVRLAHQVLRRALSRAVTAELVSRNVAASVSPPKSDAEEVQILDSEQIALVLSGLAGHWLHPIATLAIGSGCRRGELLALRWQDIDLDKGEVRVERSLEQTRAGLRFKAPKNKFSRRALSLGPSTISIMRAHYREQLEIKMAVGHRSDLVFATVDGNPRSPDHVTTDWRRVLAAKGLPSVNFHALRHTHASALIAGGLDIVSVSRRLGHGSPNITLSTYAHLFTKTDTKAADAIERILAPKLAPK